MVKPDESFAVRSGIFQSLENNRLAIVSDIHLLLTITLSIRLSFFCVRNYIIRRI